MFEYIWGKLEAIFLGFFAGSIWSFIFYKIITTAYPEISISTYYVVFVTAFIVVSVSFKEFLEYSGFGSLYALYAYIATMLHIDHVLSNIDISKIAKELVTCLVIGSSAGAITLLLE